MKSTHTTLLALAFVSFPATLGADTIFRTDGKPIEDCRIVREDLTEVTYKEGKDKGTIPSEKVVRIEYDKLPKLLDRAEDSFKNDEFEAGMQDIADYLDAVSEKGDRKFLWGPAYAMHRTIVLKASIGNASGVISAAKRLIQDQPESRYVPAAYIAMAEAYGEKGDLAKARSTLQDLGALIDSKGLSNRWQLESELEIVLLDDSLSDDARRTELARIGAAAGDSHPTVRSRAELAEAESYLADKEFAAAQKLLEGMIATGMAEEATLAGAHTGLGDVLYQRAVDSFKAGQQKEAEALLRDALLNYMRVIVTYIDQSGYVAKSMFFAGRAFDQFQDDESKDRAQRMYKTVRVQFPESGWAKEARGFRK